MAKREPKKSDNGFAMASCRSRIFILITMPLSHASARSRRSSTKLTTMRHLEKLGVVVSGVRASIRAKASRSSASQKANLSDTLDLLHNEIAVGRRWTIQPSKPHFLDVFEDAEHLTLVTELMHGGDFFKRLRNAPNGRFDEIVASRFVAQIAAAVAYLHHHGVVHCDLEAGEFVGGGEADECELYDLTVKVADFGLSQTVEKAVNLGRQRTQELSATAGAGRY